MPARKYYAVDRIKKKRAVLVDDTGDTVEVPVAELPADLREGVVLQVPLGADGSPDWPTAQVDAVETARRLAEAERLLDELRRRDPGGDVKL